MDLDQLRKVIAEENSFRGVARELGEFSHTTYKKIADQYNIDHSHFTHGQKNKDLVGTKFNRLLIKELELTTQLVGTKRRQFVLCLCDCGKECTKRLDGVKSGRVISCGCAVTDKGRFMEGNLNPAFAGEGEFSASKFADIKRNASRRKIQFNVTIEFCWQLFLDQDRKCNLSGVDLYFGPYSHPLKTNASLDRIDSSKGYIAGNVQWVHKDVNLMKRAFDQKYFLEMCRKIGANNV